MCLGSSSGQETGDTIEELRSRAEEFQEAARTFAAAVEASNCALDHDEKNFLSQITDIQRWIAEVLTDYVPLSIVTRQTCQALNSLLMRAKEKLPTCIPHEFIEIVYSSDQAKLAILHENLHVCPHHIRDHHTMQRRALSIG